MQGLLLTVGRLDLAGGMHSRLGEQTVYKLHILIPKTGACNGCDDVK